MIDPLELRGGGITHRELLLRARADLHRELNALTERAAAEGLPGSFYDEERRALRDKVNAVNAMLRIECGEVC